MRIFSAGESGELSEHVADTNNPHSVIHTQAGADVAGSSAVVQGNLNTHTVNESNPHAVTAEQVGATEYINRGDPTSHDFLTADFIKDSQWHDLDLSNIVPEGVTFVHLRIKAKSILVNYAIHLRKKGDVNEYNINVIPVQVANVTCGKDKWVVCDSNRKIEYKVTGANWATINILIKGWFKP